MFNSSEGPVDWEQSAISQPPLFFLGIEVCILINIWTGGRTTYGKADTSVLKRENQDTGEENQDSSPNSYSVTELRIESNLSYWISTHCPSQEAARLCSTPPYSSLPK
jgi:hypothetical protein